MRTHIRAAVSDKILIFDKGRMQPPRGSLICAPGVSQMHQAMVETNVHRAADIGEAVRTAGCYVEVMLYGYDFRVCTKTSEDLGKVLAAAEKLEDAKVAMLASRSGYVCPRCCGTLQVNDDGSGVLMDLGDHDIGGEDCDRCLLTGRVPSTEVLTEFRDAQPVDGDYTAEQGQFDYFTNLNATLQAIGGGTVDQVWPGFRQKAASGVTASTRARPAFRR